MEGAPPRLNEMVCEPGDHAYGPLGGNTCASLSPFFLFHCVCFLVPPIARTTHGINSPLREAVASHYNRLYRQGKEHYTYENVSIASGGRLALTRIFAALGRCNIGYLTPDYPAYEDLFDYHMAKLNPICFPTREENGFQISARELEDFIVTKKLGAFLMSNPCNPTGQVHFAPT
jgi:aspartate/methionine/tyrosine aminotransferase